jgi:hypothetical protein
MTNQSLQPNLIEKVPSFLSMGFEGYENFIDPTLLGFKKLTYPSANCSIPSFDQIVPDLGKLLLGQRYTYDTGIAGNKEKFKNLGGIEMEIRVDVSEDSDLKDMIKIGYQNNQLFLSTVAGSFQIGETVKGSISGATGQVMAITGTTLTLSTIAGNFDIGETVTGQQSGATAVSVTVPGFLWHQITENVNPLPVAPHEYYFDEWFDTKLLSTVPGSSPSKNLPRAIWVNGYKNPSTKKGEVYSWTGGVAQIVSLIANTSVSIESGLTWRALGFTEDASGNAYIVVNGISHQVTVPANLDTNTVGIASTAGITVGNIATSKIEMDISPIPFDHCRQVKGYMFYGNWDQRRYYMSNAFNRDYNYLVTNFQAVQNDLTFDIASAYTGTAEAVYHVVINSVTPASNTQSYTGTGTGSSSFGITGYTGTGTNNYKIVITSDSVWTPLAGTGAFTDGEFIVGQTSGAVVKVVEGGNFSGGAALTQYISGTPVIGENFIGLSSGVTRVLFAFGFFNGANVYKNGVHVLGLTGALATGTLQFALAGNQIATPSQLDGLQFTTIQIGGDHVGDHYDLVIQTQLPDTFQWQKNGGSLSSPVSITGGFQALSDGVQIKFANDKGHTVGDFWNLTAYPQVTRAWDNFYYALPVRRPGEGYIYNLPSNFWTHDTQEDSMYVNCSYGEWSVVTTQLSADLQSESVSLTPLKQAGASKVLYPYLTGHLADELVYVTIDKNLDTLGRKPLLEKPQTGYLSDKVKLDFKRSSFVGGRIKYLNKKLYISSPRESLTHQLDTFKGYWNPPKTFPEVGILSIIGNDLICHSDVRNQSFTMFANDDGDDGSEYQVTMRTGFTDGGSRWDSKASNMSFTEGYIEGTPSIIHSLILGPNGCAGTPDHPMQPIVCARTDRSPLGAGSNGSHALGSDEQYGDTYFQEVWPHYQQTFDWYFLAIQLQSLSKNHTYRILGLGANAAKSTSGNNSLVPKRNVS